MNLVVEMGRFTKDPEVRTGANGTMIAKGNLAVDRRFKREGEADADFFSVTAFGKTAEFIEKYIRKGTKVVISGELRNSNYTDKEGVKHYGNDIIIGTIEFAESKKAEEKTDDFVKVDDSVDDELPFV